MRHFNSLLQTPKHPSALGGHETNKMRDKAILSGIERLLNRKNETVVAHTIKQISCKNETVNMLNRIGLPLAKKIKREKMLQLRKELKLSIERETQELLEYSKPDKVCSLLQSFYDNEKSMLEESKDKIYQRMETYQRHSTSVTKERPTPRTMADEIKDYQDSNLEELKLKPTERQTQSHNKKDQLNLKPIKSNKINERQAYTAQVSARNSKNRTLHDQTKNKTKGISQFDTSFDKAEKIPDFIDGNTQADSQQKSSIYQNLMRSINSSTTPQTNSTLIKGKSFLDKIQKETGSSKQQQHKERRQILIDPIPIDKYPSLINQEKKPEILDSFNQKTSSIHSDEKLSDLIYISLSPRSKQVRFFVKETLSTHKTQKQNTAISTTSSRPIHQKQEAPSFRDILNSLKHQHNLRHYTDRKDAVYSQHELKPQKSINQKRLTGMKVATFEGKDYDEIFHTVDLYQRIFDALLKTKCILNKRSEISHPKGLDLKKQQVFIAWQEAVNICKESQDFIMIFHAFKISGEIYMEFKDFQSAIKEFRKVKNFCDEKSRFKEKIFAFEQIGVCYRLCEDFITSIKFFRKQLELSWEQNDERAEIDACAQLALSYFYLGDMEKAEHFNDRMMRGKHENNDSVIKRVSKNLISSKRKHSKYEFYLNPEQLHDYLKRKQNEQNSKMKAVVDFGLSKAYSLLPHFSNKIDEQSSNNQGVPRYLKAMTPTSSDGPQFKSANLKFMNTPPPYEYLKITDPLLMKKSSNFRRNGASTTSRQKRPGKELSLREYIGTHLFKHDTSARTKELSHHKPLNGDQIYQNIIERVKQSTSSGVSSNSDASGAQMLNHLSLLRTLPKDQTVYNVTVETIEKSLDFFKQQILKKQMMQNLRKWGLGIEFEEICYISRIRLLKITLKNSKSSCFMIVRKFYGYANELTYFDYFFKKKKEEEHEEEIQFSDSYGNGNVPLIITGDEGCGKTSLVMQYLKNLQTQSTQKQQPGTTQKNHIIIYHFAGVSNCDLKYQSFIFRALVKLRQEYDIQHRVEIIDDKLRMNFVRWLELASQKHEERLDQESKIIFILDGLENFHDVDTQGEESADWIPWTFPNHIKMVMMTRKNSKAMNHFKLRKYPIIYMDGVSVAEASSMIEDYCSEDIGNQISKKHLEAVKNVLLIRRMEEKREDDVIQEEMQEIEEGDFSQSFSEQKVSANPLLSLMQQKHTSTPSHKAVGQLTEMKSFVSHSSNMSNALKYFIRKNYLKNITVPADSCKKIDYPFQADQNPLVIKCILNFYVVFNKYEARDDEMCKIMPLPMDKILACKTLKQILLLAIKHFRLWLFTTSSQSVEEQLKFDQILGYIYISRKGITEAELLELIPTLSSEQMQRFMSVFGFLFILEHHNLFIKHAAMKKAVRESLDILKNEDQKIILHRNLAMVIEKEQFSLRQIDELSHQYFMGNCWIKLKDLISNIEVFSIMFVPEIKHELATYWQCLEQHKYDPVAEYNKALEGFVVKYRPNNQELFVILIQLSRFFKELADLETKYTPQFKHPPLRGQSELESITLLGELQKLDDLYNPNPNAAVANQIAHEPMLGDVENFNVDNTIVREQIMSKIKKELEDQKSEKSKDQLSLKNTQGQSQIFYYYKRWIWVQFPWCTIDVYSNLSNIMEMSMGSHTNYISTAKENELVNGTIQILKEAKLRKKNNRSNVQSLNTTHVNSKKNMSRSMSPKKGLDSHMKQKPTSLTRNEPKSINNTMIRRTTNKVTPNRQSVALPPIAPSTAKNGNQSRQSLHQSSKTTLFRSSSAQQQHQHDITNTSKVMKSRQNLLSLSLDSEDRKSPEKMLSKLSDKITLIEKQELRNLEDQNMDMGTDLNQLTFQIHRKEKELAFLEELFDNLQSEESLNYQEKIKLETTEAKLLKAYENLNRVEVEKKRLEQIFIVCQRNPAKNQEWSLESQVESMRKLVNFQEAQIQLFKQECDDCARHQQDTESQMEDKRKLRDQAIVKVSNIIDKKRNLDKRVAKVEEQRVQILKGLEGPEKTINKLKQRQLIYRKWIAKLQVTKAFVNEKKNYYERAFRKITAVTGISNPNDIEGLLGFIERTNDLRKTKQTKEKRVEMMKKEKIRLEEELKGILNGQPQYDHTDIEDLSTKQQEKEKYLRELKATDQKQLCQIADMKSGIVNIAKKLGLQGVEIDHQNLNEYISEICEKFIQKEQDSAKQIITLQEEEADMQLEDNNVQSVEQTTKVNESTSVQQPIDRQPSVADNSSHNNKSTALDTTHRNQRKKQPKQKFDTNGGNMPSAIQNLFHHHQRELKQEDSENEERIQLRQDRQKIKQLLQSIQVRKSLNTSIVKSMKTFSPRKHQINLSGTQSAQDLKKNRQSKIEGLGFGIAINKSQKSLETNQDEKKISKQGKDNRTNKKVKFVKIKEIQAN